MRTRGVFLILLINALVFLAWRVLDEDFMGTHFLVSHQAVVSGRPWTLITSCFSHVLLVHFFVNMMVLSSFGGVVELVLGPMRFLRFYLFAGVMSSLTHNLVSNFFLEDPSMAALGASGAVSGVVLFFSLMFPREKILVFGLIPVPAIWGAIVAVGLDIWGLTAQMEGGGLPIGHGAHLGGAFAGLIYFLFHRGRLRRRGF